MRFVDRPRPEALLSAGDPLFVAEDEVGAVVRRYREQGVRVWGSGPEDDPFRLAQQAAGSRPTSEVVAGLEAALDAEGDEDPTVLVVEAFGALLWDDVSRALTLAFITEQVRSRRARARGAQVIAMLAVPRDDHYAPG